LDKILVALLERELQQNAVSDASHQWLTQCGLTPEKLDPLVEPNMTNGVYSLGKLGTIPTKLKKMRENVRQFILPEKRKRPKKRSFRISKNHYSVHSKHLK
jgi:hypothetical protein